MLKPKNGRSDGNRSSQGKRQDANQKRPAKTSDAAGQSQTATPRTAKAAASKKGPILPGRILTAGLPVLPPPPANCPAGCELGPGKSTAADPGRGRAIEALQLRREAAQEEYARLFGAPPNCPPPPAAGGPPPGLTHDCNGDELRYAGANFIASFSKGLPHDPATGEVASQWYCEYLNALDSGIGFENLLLGCAVPWPVPPPNPPPPPTSNPAQRKLENPQAAYAFDLEGADSHSLSIPPAPQFFSDEQAAEMLEVYWMALARDIPFIEFTAPDPAQPFSNPLLETAFNDLKRFDAVYWQANRPAKATLDRRSLFRGITAGDRVGPYLSQFLLMDVPFGAQVIPARIRTVQPGLDYLTTWTEWLAVQNGCDANQSACDPMPRFIRSGRDLAQFVHVDLAFNAFFNACNIMDSGRDPLRRCEAAAGLAVPFGANLPYVNPRTPALEEFPNKSKTQIGVVTFCDFHVKSALLEVITRASKAIWYQKWLVHRRLRPEEYGGRVHREATTPGTYPIARSLFESPLFPFFNRPTDQFDLCRHNALQNANKRNRPNDHQDARCGSQANAPMGTYLLPMAFAEGSPLHPSYGQGHAVIAGACVTILKAFFHEGQKIINPMVPNRDGTSLELYTGPGHDALTVGGELNKLAGNIALGRDFAGVHYRTDYVESLLLGEKIAISMLFDQRKTYQEAYAFHFTRFLGQPITIDSNSTLAELGQWLS